MTTLRPSDATRLSDPTHLSYSPPALWTTINSREGLPGVSTPLNWTFYKNAIETGTRGTWVDLGALPRGQEAVPEDPGGWFNAMFFGRPATNLDQWRYVADRMPGMSGDAIEQQFFGTVRPGVSSKPVRRRYPIVAVKAPVAAIRFMRDIRRLRAGIDEWWRGCLTRVESGEAREVLLEAEAMLVRTTRPHIGASMLASGFYEQVVAAAADAGLPGAELSLMTGMGSFEETRMMSDIWDASRGRLSLDELIRAHGFHGPAEGVISSLSWREDPAPVIALVERYRDMAEDRDPREREREQIASRKVAEQELMAATPWSRRAGLALVLRLARAYLPLREVGRAVLLRTTDAGRAAARRLGHDLADDGVVAEPGDVFFLTMEELARPASSDFRELVALRRDRYTHNLTITLPDAFSGVPEPVAVTAPAASGATLIEGTGVSPGVVEATARVIQDQADAAELEDGDVLVCHTTDPSWSSLFLSAAAVVIDIGSAMSHGAIVARELGVPCVINTTDGTRRIPSGVRVRVDGSSGTVSILDGE
ncbi:PEP-utilizing enzyme [Nocardia sp. R16R-3T]